MYCAICGETENVKYYSGKHNFLCDFCSADTPNKMSKEEFCCKYWDANWRVEVGAWIADEFYEDYRAFSGTFEEYCEQTRSDFF